MLDMKGAKTTKYS